MDDVYRTLKLTHYINGEFVESRQKFEKVVSGD